VTLIGIPNWCFLLAPLQFASSELCRGRPPRPLLGWKDTGQVLPALQRWHNSHSVPSSGEQPSSAQSHATVLVNCPFATKGIVFCVKMLKNLMKTETVALNWSKDFLTMTIWVKKLRLPRITHYSSRFSRVEEKFRHYITWLDDLLNIFYRRCDTTSLHMAVITSAITWGRGLKV
jgi:hypothetical protein